MRPRYAKTAAAADLCLGTGVGVALQMGRTNPTPGDIERSRQLPPVGTGRGMTSQTWSALVPPVILCYKIPSYRLTRVLHQFAGFLEHYC